MSSPSSAKTPNAHGGSPDLNLFVQVMVDQLNSRFSKMSDSIMGRMNEMNSRMDELELSIGELMTQAGLEQPPSPRSQERDERGHI